MKTEKLAIINNVSIICLKENKQKLIPIKPICEALGVDAKAQRNKINEDEILSSVRVLSTSTGTDEKSYEMFCLPLEFVFGWLFTINPKNVSPEAKEAVTKYKLECYKALFEYFTEPQTFLAQKQERIETYVTEYQSKQDNFKNARNEMNEAKKKLNETMEVTIEQWRANNGQLFLVIPDAEIVEN